MLSVFPLGVRRANLAGPTGRVLVGIVVTVYVKQDEEPPGGVDFDVVIIDRHDRFARLGRRVERSAGGEADVEGAVDVVSAERVADRCKRLAVAADGFDDSVDFAAAAVEGGIELPRRGEAIGEILCDQIELAVRRFDHVRDAELVGQQRRGGDAGDDQPPVCGERLVDRVIAAAALKHEAVDAVDRLGGGEEELAGLQDRR